MIPNTTATPSLVAAVDDITGALSTLGDEFYTATYGYAPDPLEHGWPYEIVSSPSGRVLAVRFCPTIEGDDSAKAEAVNWVLAEFGLTPLVRFARNLVAVSVKNPHEQTMLLLNLRALTEQAVQATTNLVGEAIFNLHAEDQQADLIYGDEHIGGDYIAGTLGDTEDLCECGRPVEECDSAGPDAESIPEATRAIIEALAGAPLDAGMYGGVETGRLDGFPVVLLFQRPTGKRGES